MRVGAVAMRARAAPEPFVANLESLLEASGRAARADADAMLACALWLLDEGEARVPELQAIAVRDGHELVAALLADDAPHRALASGGRLPELGVPETARVVRDTLAPGNYHDGVRWCVRHEAPQVAGDDTPELTFREYEEYFANLAARLAAEREAGTSQRYVRTPMYPWAVRLQVDRLARHQSSFTIGRLLDDPSILQRDVVTIAARRPTSAAIVRQLTSHLRWMQVPSVRAALVANPFTPTRAALILTATCIPRLRSFASSNVHPRVRELALRLSA